MFQWSTDTSEDCQVLDHEPRRLKDPDKGSPTNTVSWSIPIGCDAHDGDSGAPVFSVNNDLVGIIWTGQYPKEKFSVPMRDLSLDEIWKRANFMIPVSKVLEELQSQVDSKDSETQKIINGIIQGHLR